MKQGKRKTRQNKTKNQGAVQFVVQICFLVVYSCVTNHTRTYWSKTVFFIFSLTTVSLAIVLFLAVLIYSYVCKSAHCRPDSVGQALTCLGISWPQLGQLSVPCGLILQQMSLYLFSWQGQGSKRGSELALFHFYHISLVKTSRRPCPDSVEREIDPTS